MTLPARSAKTASLDLLSKLTNSMQLHLQPLPPSFNAHMCVTLCCVIADIYAPRHLSKAARAFQPQQLSSSTGYNVARAYGCSKLANILFVRQLARRLEGRPVVVAACHPGKLQGVIVSHTQQCIALSGLLTVSAVLLSV